MIIWGEETEPLFSLSLFSFFPFYFLFFGICRGGGWSPFRLPSEFARDTSILTYQWPESLNIQGSKVMHSFWNFYTEPLCADWNYLDNGDHFLTLKVREWGGGAIEVIPLYMVYSSYYTSTCGELLSRNKCLGGGHGFFEDAEVSKATKREGSVITYKSLESERKYRSQLMRKINVIIIKWD